MTTNKWNKRGFNGYTTWRFLPATSKMLRHTGSQLVSIDSPWNTGSFQVHDRNFTNFGSGHFCYFQSYADWWTDAQRNRRWDSMTGLMFALYKLELTEGRGSDVLLQAKVPIVAESRCRNAYQNYTSASFNNTICAGGDGKTDSCRVSPFIVSKHMLTLDSATYDILWSISVLIWLLRVQQGDSGGPLMWPDPLGRFYAIGIVSWGHGCALEGYPGIYTNVRDFLKWIQHNVKENS